MSRAFIKEDDANTSGEELPERPQSPHPNYVTPAGLAQLQAQLAELQAQRQEQMAHPEGILAEQHLNPLSGTSAIFRNGSNAPSSSIWRRSRATRSPSGRWLPRLTTMTSSANSPSSAKTRPIPPMARSAGCRRSP